jgi:hypothetical protein
VKYRAVLIFALAFCSNAIASEDAPSIKGLRDAMVALAPNVDPREAESISVTAHTMSRQLARQWGVGDPAYQNYLINIGERKYGYCADYARLIGARLKEFQFKTLVLHWGAAYAKEPDEDNCLVVTARNQSFYDGIVLEGWRFAGRLFWSHVREDYMYQREHYTALNQLGSRSHSGITAWKEDLKETAWLNEPPPAKGPAKTNPKKQIVRKRQSRRVAADR